MPKIDACQFLVVIVLDIVTVQVSWQANVGSVAGGARVVCSPRRVFYDVPPVANKLLLIYLRLQNTFLP